MGNLHIFYTYGLRGRLELLPRLHMYVRELRRRDSQAASTDRVLLLDLGESCAPEVWHCGVTGGRSALIVLDAMGYHAANASHLTPESRAKLAANMLQMALVDDENDWQDEDIAVSCRAGSQALPDGLQLEIILTPDATTRLEDRRLRLAAVEGGQVGIARVSREAAPALVRYAALDLPPNTPPDPTIAATVEFVLGEAQRYHAKRE